MRRFRLMLVAALAFAAMTNAQEGTAQEDGARASLQVWPGAATFEMDSVADFLGAVSFGPVLHLADGHSVGLHANFVGVFIDDDDPVATLGYAYGCGPIWIGGGITLERNDEDEWDKRLGLGFGWHNLALWLNDDGASLGFTLPLPL